jgi:autotransporter-associated beta strand protein
MAAMAALPSLQAQTTYTWTNIASTSPGGWSTAANWDANGVPVAAANSTIQFFSGTSGVPNTVTATANFNATHDLGTSFDLQTLILNGTSSGARIITINQSSSSLDFAGTANKITSSSTGSLSYTISSPVNFANGLTVDGSSINTMTISGTLTGTGGLVKTGNSFLALSGGRTFSGGLTINGGRLTLSNNGTHTGGTILNSGRLILSSDSALGASSGALTLNGGILTYSGTSNGQTRTVSNNIVIGGNVQLLDSTNIQGGATFALTGAVDLSGGDRTLTVDSSGADKSSQPPVIMSGVVSNGGIIKKGTAILQLSNAANTYSGTTTVSQGTLLVGANALEGVAGALGNATSAIELGDSVSGTYGATLQRIQLLTTGATTVGRAINVNANNTSGTTIIGSRNTSGTASYTNTITLNRGVIFASNVGGKTQFSGLINDGAGSHGVTIGNYTFGVTNTGGGVVVLNNATGNTYDGDTTVSVGSLIVNNTSGSGTGTGSVIVNSGATFGGAGRSDGAISLDAGSRMSPGDMSETGVSSVGTFTGGSSLTWNSDGLVGMSFNLGADQLSSDQLVLSGAFTKGTGSTFVFNFTGSTLNESITYTLITFGSNNGFTVGDFSAIGGDEAFQFVLNGDSLVYSAVPEPSTYAVLAGVLALAGAVWRKRRAV